MKKVITLCATLLMVVAMASAQDESTSLVKGGSWTTTSTPALKISEFFFNNLSNEVPQFTFSYTYFHIIFLF